MANKDLKDRYFVVPTQLMEYLEGINEQYSEGKANPGEKRMLNILETGKISYPQMKRIKNFFDIYEGREENKEFIMNGGERMKKWVDGALKIARDAIYNVKKAKQRGGQENAFLKTHTKDTSKNPTKVRMTRIDKSASSNNLENNKMVYESVERIKDLIKYNKQ